MRKIRRKTKKKQKNEKLTESTKSDLNDEYMDEKSHGALKSSFRMCVNVKNGHILRIVFDLDPNKVSQIGDHTGQDQRDANRDRNIAKNITKTGHNDFSSIGTVKAIIDIDTKEHLKTATTIGIIGNGGTRFKIPSDLINSKYGDESRTFERYPVKVREEIARRNTTIPKDAITYTVGESEKAPSYKATMAAFSSAAVYNNQWNKGRGTYNPKKNCSSESYRDNSNIKTHYNKFMTRFAALKKYKGTELDDDLESLNSKLSRLKQRIDEASGENYGQVASDPRYKKLVNNISDQLNLLEDDAKKLKKK